MIRLAHVSDIHLTTDNLEWQREDWFNKRMAAWINFRWLGREKLFRHADAIIRRLLLEIDERGPHHIVFSGDATALGFESELRKAAELLEIDRRPGLATPGNHDLYAIHGRHQSKRFLNRDGTSTLVTSDPEASQGASSERIVTAEMYCGVVTVLNQKAV